MRAGEAPERFDTADATQGRFSKESHVCTNFTLFVCFNPASTQTLLKIIIVQKQRHNNVAFGRSSCVTLIDVGAMTRPPFCNPVTTEQEAEPLPSERWMDSCLATRNSLHWIVLERATPGLPLTVLGQDKSASPQFTVVDGECLFIPALAFPLIAPPAFDSISSESLRPRWTDTRCSIAMFLFWTSMFHQTVSSPVFHPSTHPSFLLCIVPRWSCKRSSCLKEFPWSRSSGMDCLPNPSFSFSASLQLLLSLRNDDHACLQQIGSQCLVCSFSRHHGNWSTDPLVAFVGTKM